MDVYRSHLNVAGSNLHAPFLPMRRFEIRQEDSRRTNAFIRIERISILERKHQHCFVRRADNTFRAPPRTALLRQSYKLFASTYSKGERSAWEEWRAIDTVDWCVKRNQCSTNALPFDPPRYRAFFTTDPSLYHRVDHVGMEIHRNNYNCNFLRNLPLRYVNL